MSINHVARRERNLRLIAASISKQLSAQQLTVEQTTKMVAEIPDCFERKTVNWFALENGWDNLFPSYNTAVSNQDVLRKQWEELLGTNTGPGSTTLHSTAVEYDVSRSVLPLDWLSPQTPGIIVGYHWSEYETWPELNAAHPVYLADHPELWASPWLKQPEHLFQITAVVTNPFILVSRYPAIEVLHQNLDAIFQAGYDSVFFKQDPQDPGNASREFVLFYPQLQIKEVVKLSYVTSLGYKPNQVAHYLLPGEVHTTPFNEECSGLVNSQGGWVCQTL